MSKGVRLSLNADVVLKTVAFTAVGIAIHDIQPSDEYSALLKARRRLNVLVATLLRCCHWFIFSEAVTAADRDASHAASSTRLITLSSRSAARV